MSATAINAKKTSHAAAPSPCSACPWRTSNLEKPHPHGWYKLSNLRRLWRGTRSGGAMSCHPTDPENVVPEGQRAAPDDSIVRECAGLVLLQQREMERFQRICNEVDTTGGNALKLYRKLNPNGLTHRGLIAVAERCIFGGTQLGGVPMTRMDLNMPGVSHPDLQPWENVT